MTQIVFPGTALELKLEKDWNYQELYLACLEATAKICRVPKYRIYTVEELRNCVTGRIARMTQEEKEELPVFALFFDCGERENPEVDEEQDEDEEELL